MWKAVLWLIVFLIVVYAVSLGVRDAQQPMWSESPREVISAERIFANENYGQRFTSYTVYWYDKDGAIKHETFIDKWRTVVELRPTEKQSYVEIFDGYREPWLWFRETDPSFRTVIIYLNNLRELGAGTYQYGKGNSSPRHDLR